MIDIKLVDFAQYLADEARKAIIPYFRQNVAVEDKGDASPVTLADKEAEKVIRKLVELNFPEHGFYGEETGVSAEDAEFVWVIDPIDGTKSFITGRPLFGTLIALVQDKKPVIGVIDQPITKERWLGANGVTTFNGSPVRTRQCHDINAAYFATTSPFLFAAGDEKKIRDITSAVKCTVYGGDCYSYGQLASGGVDLVIESGLKPYDFCALVPVVENAGGKITDWYGNPLELGSTGKVIAAGDEAIHKKALEFL